MEPVTRNTLYCSSYKKTEKKSWRSYLKGQRQTKHVSSKIGSYLCDLDNKFLGKKFIVQISGFSYWYMGVITTCFGPKEPSSGNTYI